MFALKTYLIFLFGLLGVYSSLYTQQVYSLQYMIDKRSNNVKDIEFLEKDLVLQTLILNNLCRNLEVDIHFELEEIQNIPEERVLPLKAFPNHTIPILILAYEDYPKRIFYSRQNGVLFTYAQNVMDPINLLHEIYHFLIDANDHVSRSFFQRLNHSSGKVNYCYNLLNENHLFPAHFGLYGYQRDFLNGEKSFQSYDKLFPREAFMDLDLHYECDCPATYQQNLITPLARVLPASTIDSLGIVLKQLAQEDECPLFQPRPMSSSDSRIKNKTIRRKFTIISTAVKRAQTAENSNAERSDTMRFYGKEKNYKILPQQAILQWANESQFIFSKKVYQFIKEQTLFLRKGIEDKIDFNQLFNLLYKSYLIQALNYQLDNKNNPYRKESKDRLLSIFQEGIEYIRYKQETVKKFDLQMADPTQSIIHQK